MNQKLVLLAVTGTNGECPAPATYAPCRCDPAATASFPEDFTLFCPTLQGIKTHLIIVMYLYYLLELRDIYKCYSYRWSNWWDFYRFLGWLWKYWQELRWVWFCPQFDHTSSSLAPPFYSPFLWLVLLQLH